MRILFVILCSLLFFRAEARSLAGQWLVYEGSDGSELVLTVIPNGGGQAELSLVRRFSDSALVLKNLSLELPLMTWKRVE